MKKTLFLLILLAFAPAALADISSVTITAEEQLSEYTEADSMEFILGANIVDRTYRMTGAHQQWTDETPQTHDLTFSGLQSDSIGGTLYIKDELTMEKLKGVEFSGNSAQSGVPYAATLEAASQSAAMEPCCSAATRRQTTVARYTATTPARSPSAATIAWV